MASKSTNGKAVEAIADATQGRTPILVDVKRIRVVEGWNSRRTFDKADLLSLGKSMREDGQFAPILVTDCDDGTFRLVAGERRKRAAELANIEALSAIVIDQSQALRIHWAENDEREDISHADRCAWLAARKAEGMKNVEIAKLTGMSPSAVSNDIAIATGLEPSIMKEWSKKPGHSRIALLICRLPHEEQLKRWNAYLAEIEAAEAEAEPGKKGKKGKKGKSTERAANAVAGKNTRASSRDIEDLTATLAPALGAKEAPRDFGLWWEGAAWALSFAMGGNRDKKGNPLLPAEIVKHIAARAQKALDESRQKTLPGTERPAKAK